MRTKKINGVHLEKMLRNGLANLCKHETELNDLNVFPVADGDTGTNMRATLERGLSEAASTASLGTYLKTLSDAMLFGAHGNSGVILSQLIRGMSLSLSRCGIVNPRELRDAFVMGYKTAYSAVVHPVEGTILTVAREGIEQIRHQIDRATSIEELLGMYVAEMRKSLAHTPEILPQLKEAGVVDSGALGYIVIVDGMLGYLYGNVISSDDEPYEEAQKPEKTTDQSLFNEDSLFESGYCVEFVLQLMHNEKYSQRFSLKRFIADLQDFGSSIVAAQEDHRVKVHIHTLKPAKVLGLGQEYGEFVTCKVENMQIQENAMKNARSSEKERKELAIISVADSAEMQAVFRDLGSSSVLCGGSKMDVSVQNFVDALRGENAQRTVLLPNHSNLLHVARQAKELYPESDVVILDTKSILEGYCALALSNPDEKDCERRIHQMQAGFAGADTVSVATASKECRVDGVDCSRGTQIAIINGIISCTGEDAISALCNGLSRLPSIHEKETCIVLRGKDAPETAEQLCEERVRELFPHLEISFLYSGSPLYAWSAAVL